MANLKETAVWTDGIYQIEKTDPVVGGEDGISNLQAKQLADRTLYLKKQVENCSPKDTSDVLNALKNLLIGIPFPYPLVAVPDGCLAMNGQAFSKTVYPELAKKYPSGHLPDLRGEFIRGWDNGRGVDRGRSILSTQSSDFLSHYHGLMTKSGSGYGEGGEVKFGLIDDSNAIATKAFTIKGISHNAYIADDYPVQTYNAGGDETRPRNIAFQYICLAA
ncbi:phage tail protein [Basfia succiniciproducens]|uniref:phage tail protein n=1 Tax=Basfia succiniciproducens TaxID=653940 RepID=UPI003FCD1DFF